MATLYMHHSGYSAFNRTSERSLDQSRVDPVSLWLHESDTVDWKWTGLGVHLGSDVDKYFLRNSET